MINKNCFYKLKSQYVFLYDESNIYIYEHELEKIMIKVKVSKQVRDALKKLDGVTSLNEVLYGLCDKDKNTVLVIVEKLSERFFEVCDDSNREKACHDYLIKKYVQNNDGAFKKSPIEMTKVVEKSVKSSKVVCIGTGVLANEILFNVIEMGVKDIVLVDDDNVNTFDSKWGVFTKNSEVGIDRKKVIREKILVKDKDIKITLLNDVDDLLKSYADDESENIYCIVAEDCITSEKLIKYNEYLSKRFKWTCIYVDSEKISIGPTIIPKVTGCLTCKTNHIELPKYNGFNSITPHGCKMAASIFAYDFYSNIGEVEDYLIKDISITLGKQFIVNLFGLNGHSNELIIDPQCLCRRKG